MAQPARASTMTMTADEFLVHSVPDGKAELVRGELRVTPPPGAPHGVAAINLIFLLGVHARQRELGRVFGDGFGYEFFDYHVPFVSPTGRSSERIACRRLALVQAC